MDTPREVNIDKRRQTWEQEIIQDAEKYDAPDGTSRENNRTIWRMLWSLRIT